MSNSCLSWNYIDWLGFVECQIQTIKIWNYESDGFFLDFFEDDNNNVIICSCILQ